MEAGDTHTERNGHCSTRAVEDFGYKLVGNGPPVIGRAPTPSAGAPFCIDLPRQSKDQLRVPLSCADNIRGIPFVRLSTFSWRTPWPTASMIARIHDVSVAEMVGRVHTTCGRVFLILVPTRVVVQRSSRKEQQQQGQNECIGVRARDRL